MQDQTAPKQGTQDWNLVGLLWVFTTTASFSNDHQESYLYCTEMALFPGNASSFSLRHHGDYFRILRTESQ